MVFDVTREQVLAYRVAAQGLDRAAQSVSELAVLDIGVQDTSTGSARLALAARLAPELDGRVGEGGTLTLAWTVRGAPHLHRSTDLPALAAALWPLSDADALARLAGTGNRLKAAGVPGLAAFTMTAEAMRAVVTEPMTKGQVSGAVTERIPESLTQWCDPCQARHISGSLFPQAALAGGMRLEYERSPTTLAPIEGWPGVPTRSMGTARLVSAYLHLLGPATPDDVAGYLGTTRKELLTVWPDDLAEVLVDGRRAWLPETRLAALREAPPPRMVRLLPPLDPYLQARDRGLLLPDRARRAALWRMLSGPGAVLANGEIVGLCRARLAGKAGLQVTVSPFDALSAAAQAAVEDEAGRVAAVRGMATVRVRYEAA